MYILLTDVILLSAILLGLDISGGYYYYYYYYYYY